MRPTRERPSEALYRWAGRYIGPMSRDIAAGIEEIQSPWAKSLLKYSGASLTLVTGPLVFGPSGEETESDVALAQTIISTSIGIKYQSWIVWRTASDSRWLLIFCSAELDRREQPTRT